MNRLTAWPCELGIDPKSDQLVRGSVVLPAGGSRSASVFAQGDKAGSRQAAGADIVGLDDLADQIKAGQMDFDVVIASPDDACRRRPGSNPGPARPDAEPEGRHRDRTSPPPSRTPRLARVQYRTDKAGIIHATIGRASFNVDQLQTNLAALVDALQRLVPQLPRALPAQAGRLVHDGRRCAREITRCRPKPTAVTYFGAASGSFRMLLSKPLEQGGEPDGPQGHRRNPGACLVGSSGASPGRFLYSC